MTTVADTVERQGVIEEEVEESKDVVCILCLSSFMNSTSLPQSGDSDTETPFGWKKKVFELTKLDAAYLHLYENRYSFCNECQKQICLLEEVSISFENIRDQLKCISTEICRAVLQANIKMGKSVPELTSEEFQGWNARRMKQMLSEKNSDNSEVQDGEVADDVVMLHYDADLNENVEIPDIFISQLYDDFQLPIELGNDYILTNNQLPNLCENVPIKIATCDPAFHVSGNVMTDNSEGSAASTAISSVLIPEMTDSDTVTLLDENSEYSFLQFQGLTVAINAAEDTTETSTQSKAILPFQQLDENASAIKDANIGSSTIAGSKVFKCPICDASYTRKYRLSHHIKTRHSIQTDDTPEIPKKQIKCLRCPKTFTRPYSLKQHVKKIHERDVNSCEKCNRSFSTANLLEIHKAKHGNPTLECPICKKLLFYRKSFKMHFNSHYTNKLAAPVVTCNKCGISSDSPALIISHMDTHSEDYVCSISSCEKVFKSLELVEEHVREEHSDNQKKFYSCTFCPDTFEDEKQLEGHMANHNSDSFLCDECGEAFYSKNLLTAHSKSHRQPTEYKCDICAKVLHKKYSLKTHMMLHSGDKPYECSQCSHSFVQKTLLTSHIRRKHKGELPYKCPNCSHPGFSYQAGLRKHLSTDHKALYLQFKKFLCEICWKNFSRKEDLSKHTKIHEKHKCKLCHRQFRMLQHLKEHLLRHANMKLFPCPYCDESFLRKTFAVQHIKKVHDDKDAEYDADADRSTYVLTIST